MITRERLLAITLTLVMVTAAGCAGWGTDDPTTTGDQQENDTEDLNDAANESTNASANSSGDQPNAIASENTSTSESNQSSSDAESDAQSEPQQSGDGDDASDRNSTNRVKDGDTGARDDTSDTGDSSDNTTDTDDQSSDGDQEQKSKSDDNDQMSNDEPETHTLTVTVLNPDGEPVGEGMTIEIYTHPDGEKVGEATTDENGQVTFELEPYGYELIPDTEDSEEYTHYGNYLVGVEEDTEFTMNLNSPPDSVDHSTATGIVRVVNDDGEPIKGERVTITPPDAERESEKYQRVTDENGEVVIEREAKALDDFGTYGVSVRGEEKELTIKPDSRHGVQEVEFNPTHRFYQFELVLQVVDENGEPIEGATVETRHGLFPDEWTVAGETDQYGEILLTGGSSEPTDVDAREVRVRGQTLRTSIDYERKVETMQIETDEASESANETSESTMNETASANATAALAIA